MSYGGIWIGWWLRRLLYGLCRNLCGRRSKINGGRCRCCFQYGGMNFTSLGYGFCLGLPLFDIAHLAFRHKRYVFISFNHWLVASCWW